MQKPQDMYRMTIIILILAAVAGCSPRDKSGGSDSAPGAFSISGTSLTEIKGYTHEDYSGITWLGDNRYAVVTDKKDGFFEFRFDITNDGSVANLERGVFRGDDKRSRDCEGIVFHPGRGTVFISGEQDQEILEYAPDGTKTGSRLDIPPVFQKGTGNYGFEALAYSQATGLF